MHVKAIYVDEDCGPKYGYFDIGEPYEGESVVKVLYSGFCRTDYSVADKSIIYHSQGISKYPIVLGHEWCGETEDGSAVTGLCILSDSERKEVGVVNKNGSHCTHIIMPNDALIPIPYADYKFALVEPLAVCVHAFRRIPEEIWKQSNIIISGYGKIGKMFGKVLEYHSIGYDTFDVIDDRKEPRWKSYDVIVECSGYGNVLNKFIELRDVKLMLLGLEYDSIDINRAVSNEVSIYSSLGSNRNDFVYAIKIIDDVGVSDVSVDICKLSDGIDIYYKSQQSANKTIINCLE